MMRTTIRSGLLVLVASLFGLAVAPAAGPRPTKARATT